MLHQQLMLCTKLPMASGASHPCRSSDPGQHSPRSRKQSVALAGWSWAQKAALDPDSPGEGPTFCLLSKLWPSPCLDAPKKTCRSYMLGKQLQPYALRSQTFSLPEPFKRCQQPPYELLRRATNESAINHQSKSLQLEPVEGNNVLSKVPMLRC